jgi:hypothetical protein
VKDEPKRKPAGEKSAAARKDKGEKVIRLDDLVPPPGVKGGTKKFFGGR